MTKVNLEPPKIDHKKSGTEDTIHVLHVDDDLRILKFSKIFLEMEGNFEVDTASSVDEAFGKLAGQSYDAIISDYKMPQKNGLQFLQELRKKNNIVPFFIFTGKSREDVAIQALNLGADQYFNKTDAIESVYCNLARAIQQAVDRTSMHIKLLEREAKLNAILESSPEAITIIDLDGNMVECNQATVDLYSCPSKEDLIGKNVFEFIVKKDNGKAIQNMKKTIKQGSLKNVEYTFCTIDGRQFSGELSTGVVSDASGKPEYLVAITRDITERKKTEADLRRLATIVTDSNDAITVMDLNGRIIAWNKGAEDTYGYSKDEALGMDSLKIVPEDKKQEILDAIRKIKMKETVVSFETKRLAKDGHVLDIWLTATKLVNDEGKVVAIATTERNITEKKRLDERLLLSERFNVLGKLASSVAHEIRNPLGVIKNTVYFLNIRLQENTDPKVVKHLKIMENNINSANQIISDLLDLSRNTICNLQLVDLNLLLKSTFNNMSVPEDINVIYKFDKMPKIMLDPDAIRRVFLNLIHNAFAAMPQGGKLVIATSISGDSIEISFKDSGVGISEENMKKLFTPLFTTKAKGLGLGLTLSKQIVEKHNGDITVKSKVGEGALFIVRLRITSRKQFINAGLLQNDVLMG